MSVKVQLTKRHTHGRVVHDADAVIEVSEADAQWLRDNGVAVTSNKKTRWLTPVPNSSDEETEQ